MTDPRLLLLDARDNVLVLATGISAGDTVVIDDTEFSLADDLPLGHKIARRTIESGEEILKYGAPIGVATTEIEAGAHVHVHNVRSNYTPTYVLPDDGPKP